MLIPDTDVIKYKGKNKINKNKFFLKAALISLAPLAFLSMLYFVARYFIDPISYFVIVLIMYILLVFNTKKRLYNNDNRFFAHDEIAFGKDELYYNICMNMHGELTNFDDKVRYCDIINVEIKKTLTDKKLYIFLEHDNYYTFHYLDEVEYVKQLIEKEIEEHRKK